MGTGCCRYARVSFDFAFVATCIRIVGNSWDVDSWRLCLDAGYLRREEELGRFDL
jgi:hypothetical protein